MLLLKNNPGHFRYFCILVIFIECIFFKNGFSHDTHYWTNKYGTQSTLLGGNVVGSHLDLSSTFYNPGALAIIKNPESILSGWIFDLTYINYEDAAGSGRDIQNLRLSPAPDLFAGLIPLVSSKHRLFYSYLKRVKLKMRFLTADRFYSHILDSDPTTDIFMGQYFLENSLTENWVGFTWAYQTTPKMGLGITNYVAYRHHKQRTDLINQIYLPADNPPLTLYSKDFDYINFRLLWKIGFAYDFSRLKIGATITTPSINILGLGTTSFISSIVNQDTDGDGDNDTSQIFDYQNQVSAIYKTNWALSIGASYKINKTSLHLTGEWFAPVKQFEIVTNKNNQNASSETNDLRVICALNQVFNFGFGVAHSFTPAFSTYASFGTDYSAYKQNSEDNISLTNWDIYHLLGGALFRLWRFELTAGIGVSFGSNKYMPIVNFDSAQQSNHLIGIIHKNDVYYYNLKFVLGFSYFAGGFKGFPFFENQL